MSSLQSIYGFKLDSDLVQNFLKDYAILAKNGNNIILCWIPSMWEFSVMEKQSRHSPYLSLDRSFLPDMGIVGKLRAEVAAVNQVVTDMKVVLQELRRDIDSLGSRDTSAEQLTPATTNITDTSTLSVEVCRTVFEINKRKKNVVVTGLPEIVSSSDDKNVAKLLEEQAFSNFCEENLTVKPSLSNMGCRRLGKRIDTKPRRLLVHLTTEQNAQDLLQSARTVLRNSSDQYIASSVFINPDLTPADAKLAYERRQKRRIARMESQSRDETATADVSEDIASVSFSRLGSCGESNTPQVADTQTVDRSLRRNGAKKTTTQSRQYFRRN